MNGYINIFKGMESSVEYSRSSLIRKYGKKFVGFCALLLFTYIIATIIYVIIAALPDINKSFAIFFENLSKINSSNTIKVYIPYTMLNLGINYKQLLVLYFMILMIIGSYIQLFENREIIKEFDAFYNVLRRASSNTKFESKHLCMYLIYIIAMVLLTILYTSIGFVAQNVILVIIFWTSIFVLMYVYGNAKEECIKSKKFVTFLVITPILVISLFENSNIKLDTPLTIIVLLISSFLLLDRISSSYIELRKEIYDGKSLHFVINSFSTHDFDKLWKKIKVNSVNELTDLEDYIIVGITALMKSNNDINLARSCFEKCLQIDCSNHIAIYYYAITYIDEDPEKSIVLLDKINEIQKENNELDIKLNDVELWKVSALLNKHTLDYLTIINLIIKHQKNYGQIPTEYKYILAICYIKTCEFEKARILLERLNYNEATFSDIPYWLTIIELESRDKNRDKINELIKVAESFNINCEELRKRLKDIDEASG